MNQGRADRILIGIAILILALVSGAYYFDDWMWGHGRKRGEAIGQITDRRGDVRLKYEDDLKWQRASAGHDLAYNDSIYSGSGGEAHLQVGQSRMTLSENTLIVLRRDSKINFLNLNYGTLLGKIAKDDKVMIDTGSGQPILLSANKSSEIVLRREGKHTRLEVTSGEASVKVNGKTKTVKRAERVVLDDAPVVKPAVAALPAPAAPPAPKPVPLRLRAIAPLKEQAVVAAPPAKIKFTWGWGNDRAAKADETYVLEFANDPKFSHVHAKRSVKGALETTMTVSQSLSLYYRVRGPKNEISATEQVNYVALEKPWIVRPQAETHIENADFRKGLVTVEFRPPKDATVWYQIAGDADFRQVQVNQNTAEVASTRELPIGRYYLRARSDYGRGQLSDWTETVPFALEHRLEVLPLTQANLNSRTLIPNASYPPALYGASPATVSAFLAQKGLLREHFRALKPFDEIKLRFGDDVLARQDEAWPEQKLKPGLYGFKYQLTRAGYLPSAWSEEFRHEIMMEPPRAVGTPEYGPAEADGRRSTAFAFTPLLFARGYDVQLADNPNFSRAHDLTTAHPNAKVRLTAGQTYFWRARARDGEGHLISAYSAPQHLGRVPLAPPPPAPEPPPVAPLAKVEPPPAPIRAPAAEQPLAESRLPVESGDVQKLPWKRSGWWAWFGSGENYVNYRQTLSGTASIDSAHVKAGSEYVEAGYLGASGVGGVLAYKNTPGSFDSAQLKDGSGAVPITPNTYRWTTASIEAIAKRATQGSIVGAPFVYGMRIGVQQHQVPFLSLNSDATEIYLKNNQMNTASVGLLGEWLSQRWKYYSLVRYQFPLSTKADGASEFTLSPIFAFDGSVGTSYNVTEKLKLGLFVYGQWHQMRFTYADASVNQSGTQQLFYSNVDLRLGFDF